MSNIRELRTKSNEELRDLLEDAQEELFNLRFRKAAGSLEDVSRLKVVQREIARLNEVLGKREWAKREALQDEAVATAVAGKEWQATSVFDYDTNLWLVTFSNTAGATLVEVQVDLNKKRRRTRRQRDRIAPVQKVMKVEVAS